MRVHWQVPGSFPMRFAALGSRMRTGGRFLLVLVILLAAAVGSVALRRAASPPPPPAAGDPAVGGYLLFADTEGWYRITELETAVLSRYDLRLDTLPEALPMQLGPWRGESLPLDPMVNTWFDNPEVAFQRAYTNDRGDLVWLSVFGSRGPKSFRLFEHTPKTCYPLAGWQMRREDVDAIPVGTGRFYTLRGFAGNGEQELVVLYWYLWDNPQRDPADGVLSFRVSTPIRTTEEEALRVLKEDFLPHLFIDVVPWRRF